MDVRFGYKESWAQKNWWFWTVVFEKTLYNPLNCKKIKQWILKEISPEYSLKGLILKLKLQYFGYLMWRTGSLKRPWCWERLKSGGEGDDRGWDGWMASSTLWTWSLIKLLELVMNREAHHAGVLGVAKCRTGLSDQTELNWTFLQKYIRMSSLWSTLSIYQSVELLSCVWLFAIPWTAAYICMNKMILDIQNIEFGPNKQKNLDGFYNSNFILQTNISW